jgi:hypothetical protein
MQSPRLSCWAVLALTELIQRGLRAPRIQEFSERLDLSPKEKLTGTNRKTNLAVGPRGKLKQRRTLRRAATALIAPERAESPGKACGD